jgi:hypothetical protein
MTAINDTAEEMAVWEAARTLADLGELTAQWLEGHIRQQPRTAGPVDVDEDEAPGLTAALVACNRAGFVTNRSQAGYIGPSWDGAGHVYQHAAVTGLIKRGTARWLLRIAADTSLVIRLWPMEDETSGDVEYLPLTFFNGEPVTQFGPFGMDCVEEIYQGCDGAFDDLADTWVVTVYDPEPGRNDLWAALLNAAR